MGEGDEWQAPTDGQVSKTKDNGTPVFRPGAFKQLNHLSSADRDKMDAGVFPLILWSSTEIKNRLSKIFAFTTSGGVFQVGLLVQVTDNGASLPGVGAQDISVYDTGIATLSIAPNLITALAQLPAVTRIEPDYLSVPTLDVSVAETNVKFVHENCGIRGQGVVVGVLDTGIDVNHQDFFKSNGASKIAYYYSEANGAPIVSYVAPGTSSTNEWTGADLNTSLARVNATANAPDVVGHGTHVAGIAASTGDDFSDGISYIGVAPDSPLIDVQLGVYSNANILRGLWYFFVHRGTSGPMVANMSLGGPFGPHDGTTLFESQISSYVTTNHFISVSAGNDAPFTYGGTPLQQWHCDKTVPAGGTATETFTAVAGGTYLLDGWNNVPSNFAVTVFDPCGGSVGLGPVAGVSPGLLSFCPSYIGYAQIGKSNGCDRNFQVYIVPLSTATGTYTIQLTNKGPVAARFDMWTGPNGGISGTAGFSPFDRFGSGSVPGTARNVITVGSYVTKAGPDAVCGPSTAPLGSLSGFSGLGPTRAGCGAPSRVKPDVAAPGEYIMSAHSSESGAACSTSPSGHHMIDRGTSMAAPHVAGLMALYLQQSGTLTYPAMVARLAAESRPQTPFPGDPTPGIFNDTWGHGKMWIDCLPTPTPTHTPVCSNCFWADAQNANLVEGQQLFTTNTTSPVGLKTMNQPAGVFQAGNVLVVSDLANNRVLVYIPNPNINEVPAVKVIGQTTATGNLPNQGLGTITPGTLNAPKGVWTDGIHLVVADWGNNRVLLYNNIFALPPFGGSANAVIGQASLGTGAGNNGATGLEGPEDAFYAKGRLYVSDNGNNRVLVYLFPTLPTSTPPGGFYADLVIGQPNFTASNPNQDGTVSQTTLAAPYGLWDYNNTLWVADFNNNRVLGYDNIDSLSTNDPAADNVVGQSSFLANSSGNARNQVTGPFWVAADNCQLYVADTLDARVMVYDHIPAGTANPPADVVLGTGSFPSPTQNDLFPAAIAATNHTLYVADSAGSRVLRFGCSPVAPPTPTFTFTNTFTPTFTFTPTPISTPACCYTPVANWGPSGTGYSFASLFDLAVDNSGSCGGGPCVYVTDMGNNLVYKFTSGGSFIASFNGSSSGTNFSSPHGIAVNSAGTSIYVADSGNNRVVVLGPTGNTLAQFGSNGNGNGQFASDFGVALDPVNGFVYTTDQINGGRVQAFQPSGGTYAYANIQWNTGSTPFGIYVGPDEKVYVSVVGTGVKKYTATGSPLTPPVCPLNNVPSNVWADGSDDIYAEGAFPIPSTTGIVKLDSNCNFLCGIGTNGQSPLLSIGQATGVALDSSGKVYINSGNQIAVFASISCPGAPTFSPTPSPSPSNTFTPAPTFTPACSTAWTESSSNAGYCGQSGLGMDVMVDPADSVQKLWILGNGGCLATPSMQIYNSPNGTAWSLVADPTNIPRRSNFSTVVMPDPNAGNTMKMWIIGGLQGGTSMDDVWSSPDGINWTQATAAMGIGGPHFHTSVVMTDPADGILKMWVIGGQLGISVFNSNQVWCSPDGVHWTQKNQVTPFPGRTEHGSVVFVDPADGVTKMWVIAGSGASGNLNDVWCSPDGMNWTQKTNNAGFLVRGGLVSVVCGNDMWVLAGSGPAGFFNDAWVSTDGIHWSQVAPSGTVFAPRWNSAGAVFQGDVFITGGFTVGNLGPTNFNDVWETSCSTCGNLVTGSMRPLKGAGLAEGARGTATPTFTPTPTLTPTITPSPTVNPNVLVESVVAAPNVVRDNQPVHFNFTLGHPASVRLTVYNLTGEQVFTSSAQGSAGSNSLVWGTQNQSGEAVASGLYLYSLQVDDGVHQGRSTGKVAVIR